MKRIAIVQSNYVPWRGFFDLIDQCDLYIIMDSVQYRKRHWHNRNMLKGPQGPFWITIPVSTKSRFLQPVDEVEVSGPWAEDHWRAIQSNYARAPHFEALAGEIEALYTRAVAMKRLTDINELFLRWIARRLGVTTDIQRDHAFTMTGARSERLISLCRAAGATHYLSGPSAKEYLDVAAFEAAGLTVEWMHYPEYPPYPQQWRDFSPAVSALDFLLNAGDARPDLWRSAPV